MIHHFQPILKYNSSRYQLDWDPKGQQNLINLLSEQFEKILCVTIVIDDVQSLAALNKKKIHKRYNCTKYTPTLQNIQRIFKIYNKFKK